MTMTNTTIETANVRALTDAEIDNVGGGVTFGGYLRNLAWQLLNAPANSELIGCSDDMSTCSYQSK